MIQVEFGDAVEGWLVDIGDSPTNDGSGGDRETTEYCAEAQRVHQSGTAALALISKPAGPSKVDTLLQCSHLDLTGAKVEFEICDQSFAFRPAKGSNPNAIPHLSSATPNWDLLFALADQDRSPFSGRPDGPDNRIFVAFNRVIGSEKQTAAAGEEDREPTQPAGQRIGRGVKRTKIYLKP